jgi:hypothetical protein
MDSLRRTCADYGRSRPEHLLSAHPRRFLIEPVLNDRPAKAAARSALSTPTHDHCGICTDACPSCGDAWKLLLDGLS